MHYSFLFASNSLVCSVETSVEDEVFPTDDDEVDTDPFSVLCDIVGEDVVELIAISDDPVTLTLVDDSVTELLTVVKF